MKRNFILAVGIGLLLLLQSCTVHRHTVGNGPVGKDPNVELTSEGKSIYLLAGFILLQEAEIQVPESGGYQIKTSTNVIDFLVSSITASIITMRTVRVFVKSEQNK